MPTFCTLASSLRQGSDAMPGLNRLLQEPELRLDRGAPRPRVPRPDRPIGLSIDRSLRIYMTSPLPALLTALNRAIEAVERNDDPWLRSIAVAALQRELGDLVYRVPADPDIALPLERIARMVENIHAGHSAPFCSTRPRRIEVV